MRKIFFTFMTVLLATLAAQAATPINVGGVNVSCDRDQTITASCITSGTVTYTRSTNTLTLTNVTMTRTGSSNYCIHNRSNDSLIVKFVGICNLTAEARVIRDQSSGYIELIATSGATVNLKSTGDGAIYLRDFTVMTFVGPGTFNITGDKDGAIAGHGDWNATTTDHSTFDHIRFNNVTATVTGAQSALLGLETVAFQTHSNVTLKATNNSSYPVVRDVFEVRTEGHTAILAPWGAEFSSSSESIVLNGNKIYYLDIYISDNYALLLNDTNFPDANFRNALLALYPKGYLTQSELNNLTSLNVANRGISDMQGIEKLTALKSLYCYNNSFTSLNLNGNTELTYLDCATNTQLTSLSISSCTNLETLICYQTGITSLALSNLSKLKTLKCYNTKLTSLTVSNKSQLTTVECQNCTSMTTLDASGCTALATLECFTNALTTLNVTGNTAMTYLSCHNNYSMTTITGLANCTALKNLRCYNTSISNLSAVNNFSNLEVLSCSNTKISSLTLTNKTKLTEVYCNVNPQLTTANIYSNSALTDLNISNCTALTTLNCYSNKLSSLDVSYNTALKTLNCYYNSNLATITGLANCTAITTMQCFGCALTDLSACNSMTNLATLHCSNNKISSLTLTNKTKLTDVNAYENPNLTTATITGNSMLTSLNIYSCPALTTLNCYSNKLSSLGLSGNTALTTLKCYSNQLTALNVNNNTNLQYLACSDNRLTSLNVANKTAMHYLACNGNQLNSLSMQGCSALTDLYCYENNLTSLSVQGCTALNLISCYKNQITAAGMTTLVNSLPTRSSSNQGVLYVQYNTNEGNVFDASHLTTAQAKYWYPKKYNGSRWEDITGSDTFLVLPNITAAAGSTVTIPIGINDVYDHDYAGFQLCFFCPAEFEVVRSEKGELLDDGTQTQLYSSSRVVDGRIRYMMIVMNPMTGNNNPLVLGDEGTILYVTVKVPADASGEYAISLEEASFAIVGAGYAVYPDNVTATLTIGGTASTRGDVDGDGNVTIDDVTALIDYLLGSNSNINQQGADCDQSGGISIDDVTALIDYLLTSHW